MDTPDQFLQKFGERLRELRRERGYSQEEFAAECELDRTYVSGIERGTRNVSLRKVRVISEALGVRLSVLFEGM